MTSHRSPTRFLRLLVSLFLVTTGCALDGDLSDSAATSELIQQDPVFRWSSEQRVSSWSSGQSPALGANAGIVYMVHAGGCTGCTDLWWGKFSGTSWQGDWSIPGEWSNSTPSLASFGGILYMTYSHGNDVMFARFNQSTSSWAHGTQLPFQSLGAPGLAQFGSRLYFVYADPATAQLHMRSMDGNLTLSADQPLAFQFSPSAPALAVFQSRLYMVHAASGGMVYNSFDGVSWGADLRIPGGLNNANQASPNTPALAAFGANLHLLHNEPGTGDTIWWTEFHGGTSWDVEQSIPTQLGQPSLAPEATKLVMSHGSSASSHLLFYATFQ